MHRRKNIVEYRCKYHHAILSYRLSSVTARQYTENGVTHDHGSGKLVLGRQHTGERPQSESPDNMRGISWGNVGIEVRERTEKNDLERRILQR